VKGGTFGSFEPKPLNGKHPKSAAKPSKSDQKKYSGKSSKFSVKDPKYVSKTSKFTAKDLETLIDNRKGLAQLILSDCITVDW